MTSIIKFPPSFINKDPLTAVLCCINLLIKHESQSILFILFCHHSMLSLLLLYRQVLFTFCDIITIFTDNYSEINPVLRMISDWVIMGNFSSLPAPVQSHILIVVSDISNTTPTYNVLKIKTLHHSLHQLNPQSHINTFSLILLLSLSLTRFLSDAQHQHIRNVLDKKMNKIRALKAQYCALFSAIHLFLFFHHALISITQIVLQFLILWKWAVAETQWNKTTASTSLNSWSLSCQTSSLIPILPPTLPHQCW